MSVQSSVPKLYTQTPPVFSQTSVEQKWVYITDITPQDLSKDPLDDFSKEMG